MSDTAQIIIASFMALAVIAGLVNAIVKNQAMTIYCMGVAILMGVFLF